MQHTHTQYDCLPAHALLSHKEALQRMVFHTFAVDKHKHFSISPSGRIEYEMVLPDPGRVIPADLSKAEAKKRARTLLKELADRLAKGYAPANQQEIQPTQFPSDFPNIFATKFLKLESVTPVYSDNQLHPYKAKMVEFWEAKFQQRAPLGKTEDGKRIYASIEGASITFIFKKIIHRLTSTVVPITGSQTVPVRFPFNTTWETLLPAAFYRRKDSQLYAMMQTLEGAVPIGEGDVGGRPLRSQVKKKSNIYPHPNILENYSNIWRDMLSFIPQIPTCSILWDIYNLSTVYEDYPISSFKEWIEKEVNTKGENGVIRNTVEMMPEDRFNPFKNREIYVNVQNYSEIHDKDAAGYTVGEISTLYCPNGITFTSQHIYIDFKYNPSLQHVDSFNGFEISNSNQNLLSLITLRANKPDTLVVYYDYSNREYNESFNLRGEVLKSFMKTFFHELSAHIIAHEGKGNFATKEHNAIGWNENLVKNERGGLGELIESQIEKALIQKKEATNNGFIYLIDTQAPFSYYPKENYLEESKNQWREAIKRISLVLKDPYFDTQKYISALPELYKKYL